MSRRLPSPSIGLRTVGRQLASQPAIVASVVVIVLVAALGLSLLPRSLETASREDLIATLTESLPAPRNLSVTQQYWYRPGRDDPMEIARRFGERFLQEQSTPLVNSVVASTDMVVTSPQFEVLPLPDGPERPAEQVFIDFRHQDAVWDLVEVREGRLPARGDHLTVQFPCPPDESECRPVSLQVIEVGITAETAEESHLAVGDRVLLVPNVVGDAAWESVPGSVLEGIRLVMEVTGIIELADPSLDIWFGDRTLHFPREVFVDLDHQWTESTGLIDPAAYPDVLQAVGGGGPPWWQLEWRYFFDPEQVARSDVNAIRDDLVRLRLANPVVQAGTQSSAVGTSLPELIGIHLDQREQTLRIMALTIAGIVATVTFALLALGILSTERQRQQLILARDRGASAPQVLMSRLYQAVAMTAVPVAAAYAAVAALIPDTAARTPRLMAVLLAVAAMAALVVPVWNLARLPLGTLRSEVTWPPQRNPRRVVFEVLLILVAVACVFLVRRRDPTTAVGFDWLLVATPALVGAAAGIVAVRLAGPISSVMSWLASRGRGAVSFVALRSVVQQPPRVRVPLAVLVVCMATASLSVVMTRSIEDGQLEGSWLTVGADYVLTNSGLPLPEGLTDVAGGETVHAAVFRSRTRIERQRTNANVVAIDAPRHDEVFGETPAASDFGRLATPTARGAIPAIVSSTWTSRTRPFVGQEMMIPVGDAEIDLEIIGMIDEYAGIRAPFVIVDRAAIEQAAETTLATTMALISGPRSLGGSLSELVAGSSATLVSRYDVLDELAADPMVRWATRGIAAAALLAAVVGVISIIAAFVIGAARRRQDLGYLRTLGLRGPQATMMTLIEQIPGVALALALGLVTGAVTSFALRPALDLSAFTGDRATPLTIDWVALAVLFGAALFLLVATGVIFVLVNRRQDLGQVLRVGDR